MPLRVYASSQERRNKQVSKRTNSAVRLAGRACSLLLPTVPSLLCELAAAVIRLAENMSCVPDDIWCHGHVVAYMSPVDEGVTYASMNALCAQMHALEPRVKFDNREWLGRVHYLLYLGDHALALAAFQKATEGDGRTSWHPCLDPATVSQPQLFSQKWQDAQNAIDRQDQ